MCTITVQFDALEALADELAGLAAELEDDAALCRSAAAALSAALDGDEGWTAGRVAVTWSSLTGIVAGRTAAVAAMLTAAVHAYRAADAELSAGIADRRPGTVPG